MTTISTLPLDALGEILQYVTAASIFYLLNTGDRRFMSMVEYAATIIRDDCRHGQHFPFSAFRLPNLRSVIAVVPVHGIYYLDMGDTSLGDSTVRHKKLQTLELNFGQAGTLLSNASEPLSSRFPSLTSLALRYINKCEALVDALSQLPTTLTKLDIRTRSHGDYDLPLRIFKSLSSLTELTVYWASICIPDKDEFDEEKFHNEILSYWPPNLHILQISEFVGYTILDHLPPNLELLEVSLDRDDKEEKDFFWKLSKIPQSLTSIWLDDNDMMELDYDAPWPPNLTSCQIFPATPIPVEKWPPTISFAPNALWRNENDVLGSIAALTERFPNINSVIVDQAEHMPPGLDKKTNLKQMILPAGAKTALPPNLTTLRAFDLPKEVLELLPSSIRYLGLESSNRIMQHQEILDSRLAYGPRDLSSLPVNLVSLVLSMMPFCEVSGDNTPSKNGISVLKPLKALYRLEKLTVTQVKPGHVHPSAQFLVDSLPTALEELDILFVEPDIDIHEISYEDEGEGEEEREEGNRVALDSDQEEVEGQEKRKEKLPRWSWLERCDLSSQVPNLRRLLIRGAFSNKKPLRDALKTLPERLFSLALVNLMVPFEVDTLSHLPRFLINLHLKMSPNANPIPGFTNEHFKNLPKKLNSLDLHLPTLPEGSIPKIDSTMLEYLPIWTTEVFFGGLGGLNDSLNDAAKNRLRNIPFLQDYLEP